MILDGKTLTPTELIRLHIQLETEDVRDDDTLRLVSVVEASPASTPRATAAQAFTAALHGDEGGQVGSLAEPLLARVLWDQRGMET